MKILIWGTICVGKSKASALLAEKLGYKYFNLNDEIKKKYGTIDLFNEKYPVNYDNFKEKETIALDIINNNDNFIMSMSFIFDKSIVDNITNTDSISVELTDTTRGIFNKTLFYDENDQVYPDSKQYLNEHKDYYMMQIRNDRLCSRNEYRDIPKFKINERKIENIIDELDSFIKNLQ